MVVRKTWEKAVYYLLLKYRSKHLENYNMEEDEDRQRQQKFLKGVSKPLLSVVQSDGIEELEFSSPEQEQSIAKEQTMHIMSQLQEEATCPAAATRPTAPMPERAMGQGDTIEINTDDNPSTPRQARVISSPTTSRNPPVEADTDIFTATPRRVPIPSVTSGPSPLPLPMQLGSTVIDPPILPLINLQEATPIRLEKKIPIQSNLSSDASSSPGAISILGLPGIVMPNLDNVDENVQRFFHQIVEHLNNMQMWQSSASASTHSSSATPEFSIREAPGMTLTPQLGPQDTRTLTSNQVTPEPLGTMAEHDPDEVRFQDATEESEASPDLVTGSEVLGLGISDQYRKGPSPVICSHLQQQQQLRPPPPGRAYTGGRYSATKRSYATSEDKENIRVKRGIVEPESLPLLKKSSLRSSGGKNKNLGDKHVHILLPSQETEEPRTKPKKASFSGAYEPSRPLRDNTYVSIAAETSPVLSDGSFFLLAGTTPRRSWFTNLFNFKPASYHLLSVHDTYTTKEECARVLRGFGVTVLTDMEASHVLKCKLEEIRGTSRYS